MSASGPSDPRLLLPEWLRDGDILATAQRAPEAVAGALVENAPSVVEIDPATLQQVPVATAPPTPFSERLSLDTRLDPGQLVSAADLPTWLGGLERVSPTAPAQTIHSESAGATAEVLPVEEPEPYLGVDAPDERAVDVEVSGWMLVAGALGLMILILAALKLYLS